MAEQRRTTVALDPVGPVVREGSGTATVLVTGRMVVTTAIGPSTQVPVDERVVLHRTGSADGDAHWVVTDIGTVG